MTARRLADEDEVERLTRAGIERDAVDHVDEPGPEDGDLEHLRLIEAGLDYKNGSPSGVKKRPRWTASHVRARALAAKPLPARLAIDGMPTLERCTRGGLPTGARVTITGAPGASKTTLTLQWAHEWALAGARIVYLCADQDPDQVLARLGERLDVERDVLEGLHGDDERRRSWNRLARELEALPNLVFLDGGEDGYCIEAAAEVLDLLPGDGPRVLIVDSVQEATCQLAASLAAQGMLSRVPRREQIDAAGRACRRLARRGILVIIVSEMSRGAYSSADAKRRTSALASSKESGSIEYRADLLMVLQRQRTDPDLVDVEVPKSRLGEELKLRLKIQRRRAALVEVEGASRPEGATNQAATVRAEVLRDAAELAKLLAQHPNGLGTKDLRDHVRASLGWGTPRTGAALAALSSGRVTGVRAVDRTPGTRGRTWALEHLPVGGEP
jgi:KaiC/GvpD/RAD55 family RecA-like ATPase